ncbi:phosphatidylinositol 4-phosphate 3-kinase C2 domain-containing subunit alpha-like, partial [Bombina bombina]
AEDDKVQINLNKHLGLVDRPYKEPLTRQNIEELLDIYHDQVSLCMKNEGNKHKVVEQVIKAVRNLCKIIDGVETQEITEAVKKLKRAVNLPRSRSIDASCKPKEDGPHLIASDAAAQCESPLQESLTLLTTAVHNLLLLHFNSCSNLVTSSSSTKPLKEASTSTDHLQFTIFAAHGLPISWVSSFEKYYLICSLIHNGKDVFKPVQSKKVGTYKSFFYLVKWDELIIFPIQIAQLPLESTLQLKLYGLLNPNSGGSPDSNKQRKGPELLGQVSLPLFNFKRLLTCGTKLLNLWTSFHASPGAGTINRKTNPMQKIVLQ